MQVHFIRPFAIKLFFNYTLWLLLTHCITNGNFSDDTHLHFTAKVEFEPAIGHKTALWSFPLRVRSAAKSHALRTHTSTTRAFVLFFMRARTTLYVRRGLIAALSELIAFSVSYVDVGRVCVEGKCTVCTTPPRVLCRTCFTAIRVPLCKRGCNRQTDTHATTANIDLRRISFFFYSETTKFSGRYPFLLHEA